MLYVYFWVHGLHPFFLGTLLINFFACLLKKNREREKRKKKQERKKERQLKRKNWQNIHFLSVPGMMYSVHIY